MSITELPASRVRPAVWQPALANPQSFVLPTTSLLPGWYGQGDASGVSLVSETMQRVLSSAPLGGGLGHADAWINQRIEPDEPLHAGGPAAFIDRAAAVRGLPATCVGMMTAASMRSLRIAAMPWRDQRLSLVLTAGLANARRAGDAADTAGHEPVPAGTINMALLLPEPLTDDVLVDIAATLTEAKTVALAEAGIMSSVSGRPATGTGTDALAIFSPLDGASAVSAAGKHTQLGERIARLTIAALGSAIRGCQYDPDRQSADRGGPI